MRRLRPTVRRLQRIMRKGGVGAGVVVTAATAGSIYAWLFRGAPQPGGVEVAPPVQLEIDLIANWTRHTIVEGLNGSGNPDGADGVYLADINGDNLADVVSGHEQGLRATVSLHPGLASVRSIANWHATTVTLPTANMCSIEDAIFCDVDQDGAQDVAAVCETGTNRVEIIYAPTPPNTDGELLTQAGWTRVQLTASANHRSMRVLCEDVAGDDAPELIVGEKDAGVASSLGYYSSSDPRNGASWSFTPIVASGWIMQMFWRDVVGPGGGPPDGIPDLVVSDKEGINTPSSDNTHRGLKVMVNNGADPPTFTETWVSALEGQWKWFDLYDWDGDGDLDVAACRSEPPSVHEQALFINAGGGVWTEISIPIPSGVGFCQHTTVQDLDKDGFPDIATSFSQATNLTSLTWQKRAGLPLAATFERGEISGITDVDSDVKLDNLAWYDMDGDGDLDAVTTEQHAPNGNGPGLGVVWYENPLGPVDPDVGDDDDAPPDDSDDADDSGGGAIACAALTSGTGTASTTAVTASVAPTANAVVYVAVMSAFASGPAAPTVSGNGLTYVQVATQAFHTGSARRLTVFRALGASPSAGAITADWGATSQTSFIWSVVECTDVNTSGTNGSGATVQSVIQTAASPATTLTATLAALESSSSVHLAFTALSVSSAATAPDADFAELTDNNLATGTSTLESQWATNQQSVTPTFASANAATIAIEVR